jgi:hypothetical protein
MPGLADAGDNHTPRALQDEGNGLLELGTQTSGQRCDCGSLDFEHPAAYTGSTFQQ